MRQKRQAVSDRSGTVVNMEQDKEWKQGRDKIRWRLSFSRGDIGVKETVLKAKAVCFVLF